MAAVDLGADAGVADLGMHRIGEIDRSGATRQGDKIALRREAEHLILEHLELCMLKEFLGPRRVLEDVQQLPQPAILPSIDGPLGPLLVTPVGGDAQFGDLMHIAGADLELDALFFRSDHSRMQRLIAVRLGRTDVVLETTRNHGIGAVKDAQRAIAVGEAVDHSPKSHDVRQLLKRYVLALHLAPNRIGRLLATRNDDLDPRLPAGALQPGHEAVAAGLATS